MLPWYYSVVDECLKRFGHSCIWTRHSGTSSSRWCGWRQRMHGPGGSDRQECWPGMGRSQLQHLLSTGLCLGSVLLSPAALSHSWGPDWTAVDEIKAPKGTGCRGEGSSQPITYTRRMCFFLHTFKDVKRNVSAVHHGLVQSCFHSVSGAPHSLSAANQTHYCAFTYCSQTCTTTGETGDTVNLWRDYYLQVVSHNNTVSLGYYSSV